ncbi:hypothetical protein SELMODRAFT_411569 [Selaginella moellendorffii]|uniref:Kinesin motor domain-containing protein n=1 Tax=Selaginella moellendorffii TaxID=88036 RepID=D8RIC6_SELML|nr:hypothetical protein SELMODRAFT_411569 [Selaginella moellendorffii]
MSERSRALERNPTAFASRTIDPSISRSQADVFDFVALPIVQDAMNAINGTVLAYGQVLSRIIHAMRAIHYGGRVFAFVLMGHFVERTDDPGQEGILLRVARWIFQYIPKYMNANSSRSHCVLLITIQQTNSKDRSVKTGKLFLVDLAGSEKVEKTCAKGKESS